MTPDYTLLPPHLREGMRRYVEDRVLPGGFCQAVLANDFAAAVIRADLQSSTRLDDIGRFLFDLHPKLWGSGKAVEDWVSGKTRIE